MKQPEAWKEPLFVILPSPIERVLFYLVAHANPNLRFKFVHPIILKSHK